MYYLAKTSFDTYLAIDDANGNLLHAVENSPGTSNVLIFIPSEGSDACFLLSQDGKPSPSVFADELKRTSLSHFIQKVSDEHIVLKNPTTGKFLNLHPQEDGATVGAITATGEELTPSDYIYLIETKEIRTCEAIMLADFYRGSPQINRMVDYLIISENKDKAAALVASVMRLRADDEIRKCIPQLSKTESYKSLFPHLSRHLSKQAPHL